MISWKVVLAGLIAAGYAAGQSGGAPASNTLTLQKRPPERCSMPLITIVPQKISPMPMLNPKSFPVSERFYVKPPAPPCEKESTLVSRKPTGEKTTNKPERER
jgi:hypothetical protein